MHSYNIQTEYTQMLYLVHYSGFLVLLLYALTRLPWAASAHVLDKVASVLLLTGLGALCLYNARLVAHKHTEHTCVHQYRTRFVAHTSMLTFFVLTLLPITRAVFQPYDWLALVAHAWMVVVTWMRSTIELPAVVLLMLYFVLSAMDKMRCVDADSVDIVQVMARLLLVIAFSTQLTTQMAAVQLARSAQ
jgi:hypothetical protein